MDFAEMIEDVSDEVRNTNAETKIKRWLNTAQLKIATTYMFKELLEYFSQPTVIGNPDIDLGINALWLRNVQIPGIRQKLFPRDESIIAESHPDYRTLKGQTNWYYLNGLTTVGLFYVPASIQTITGQAQRRPTRLVNDDDICELPEEWHELVCLRAKKAAHRYDGNRDAITELNIEETKLKFDLRASANKRPDDTLVIGSEVDRTGRPGRPTFPSNYPRV